MIVVLTSLSYCAAILPAFVAHYAERGAERVVVSVHGVGWGDGELAAVTDLFSYDQRISVEFRLASKRWRETGVEAHNKNELRSELRLRRGDWFVPADLDEFTEYDRPLPDLVAALERDGCEYAMGTMVDHVAASGALTAYDPSRSLAEQYPTRANVTKGIMGQDNRKVVLCRGDRSVLSGHHRVFDQSIKPWPVEYEIAHYAWRAGRRQALERRVANYRRLRACSEYPPALKLFKHLDTNGGRLDLARITA